MNCFGAQFGHQQQVEASAVALADEGRHPLSIDQQQAQNRHRQDRPGRERVATLRFGEELEAADDQRHHQHEDRLDDDRLRSVGTGAKLSPEDRVVPGLAVWSGRRGDPAVGTPGDMQAGRLATRADRSIRVRLFPSRGDGRRDGGAGPRADESTLAAASLRLAPLNDPDRASSTPISDQFRGFGGQSRSHRSPRACPTARTPLLHAVLGARYARGSRCVA